MVKVLQVCFFLHENYEEKRRANEQFVSLLTILALNLQIYN